ncbi:chloride channel protein [Gandjariella thermophila]|uniref:Chloride channel protein n=1 Tax=Gandjariella thermophila TaxID=1931992 RepID=A0A4D4J0A6_9PSEU|nr:chloride channel protein [Gandjariella thermophila]GDY29881.1 chloride channel protein [Gandjariella thermophila]
MSMARGDGEALRAPGLGEADDPRGHDRPPGGGRGGAARTGRLRRLLGLLARLLPRDRAYFRRWVPLGVVIGAVAGFGAIALRGLLDLVTHGLLGELSGFHPATVAADGGAHPASGIGRWWAVPLAVAGGALVSALLVRWLAPETSGHGTDAAIDAIHHDPKGMRSRVTVVKMVASALTLGSGGSGGTEGPAAQISAAFGSVVARVFRLTTEEARTAVAAGLASGVGAVFRAPFGGALLGVELPYRRDMAGEMLVPSLIASIVAYLEFGAAYGFGAMFGDHPALAVAVYQLPLFLVLGVLAGLTARCFCWAFYRAKAAFDGWGRVPSVLRPAVAGLAVGAFGLLLPEVLGTSYGVAQSTMDRYWLLGTSLWVVLAFPLAKILATSLTVGSGGSGGVFGPGMVIGAGVGAAFWRLLAYTPIPLPDPAVFVLVGMAACLGSAIHAPVAVTVMVAEVTGSAGALFPAILAVAAATLVVGDVSLYRSQPHKRTSVAEADPAPNPPAGVTAALNGHAERSQFDPGMVSPVPVPDELTKPGCRFPGGATA